MTGMLFSETVILRNREKTGVDELNDDVYAWVETTSPAWLEARQGTEDTDARESSTSNMNLFVPEGQPFRASTEVLWRDQEWQADGEPAAQPGGFVVPGYIQGALKRVTS